MFAHDHPDEVAGLVLVDPRWPSMTPDHLAALGAPRAGEPTTVTEVRDYLASDGFSGESVGGLAYVEAGREAAAVVAPRTRAFGDRPVVVLQATGTRQDFPDLPKRILDEWWRLWIRGHDAYAAESTHGEVRVVPGAFHAIQETHPEAVAEAIVDVLGLATD